jgi:hypothetical protein
MLCKPDNGLESHPKHCYSVQVHSFPDDYVYFAGLTTTSALKDNVEILNNVAADYPEHCERLITWTHPVRRCFYLFYPIAQLTNSCTHGCIRGFALGSCCSHLVASILLLLPILAVFVSHTVCYYERGNGRLARSPHDAHNLAPSYA